MNVQDVLNSQDGALIMGLEGTITKSWPRTQAGNGYFQNFKLADDMGQEIDIKAWDHDAHFEPGMRVRISARQNDKKQWGGTARESYQNKVRVAVKKYAPVEILGGNGTPPAYPPAGPAANANYSRRPDPVFPGERADVQSGYVFTAPSNPPMVQNRAQSSPGALTEAEAREIIKRNFWCFLGALSQDYELAQIEAIPPHIAEVAASWATHVSIGIQQGKIQRDAEQDGGQ